MSKRNQYSPEQKTNIVLEVLREEQTVNEIAAKYGVHPVMVARWKQEFLEHVPEVFKHLLRPNVKADSDECRLYYVALSRAEDFLCIATDELSPKDISSLARLGIKQIRESAPPAPAKNVPTRGRTLPL